MFGGFGDSEIGLGLGIRAIRVIRGETVWRGFASADDAFPFEFGVAEVEEQGEV